MENHKELKCIFCGKKQSEVEMIILGSSEKICICNECVEICNEILISNGYQFKNNNKLLDKNLNKITEEMFVKEFHEFQTNRINDFAYSSIREDINSETLLAIMENLKLQDSYKFEYNLLKGIEELYNNHDFNKGVNLIENSIDLSPNNYLPYIFFIKFNWKDKEHIEKSIQYCQKASQIAIKNNDIAISDAFNDYLKTLKTQLFVKYNVNNFEEGSLDDIEYNKNYSSVVRNSNNYNRLHLIIEQVLVKYGKRMNIDDLEQEINSIYKFTNNGNTVVINRANIQTEIYKYSNKFERNGDIVYLKY